MAKNPGSGLNLGDFEAPCQAKLNRFTLPAEFPGTNRGMAILTIFVSLNPKE